MSDGFSAQLKGVQVQLRILPNREVEVSTYFSVGDRLNTERYERLDQHKVYLQVIPFPVGNDLESATESVLKTACQALMHTLRMAVERGELK